MDLNHVILGPVQTEKSERQKAARIVTIRVAPAATKVDVQAALKRFFGVAVASIRMQWIRPKVRELGAGRISTRRHAWKKATLTLDPKSPMLDLAEFQSQ
jgi:ribosomal protein L23